MMAECVRACVRAWWIVCEWARNNPQTATHILISSSRIVFSISFGLQPWSNEDADQLLLALGGRFASDTSRPLPRLLAIANASHLPRVVLHCARRWIWDLWGSVI